LRLWRSSGCPHRAQMFTPPRRGAGLRKCTRSTMCREKGFFKEKYGRGRNILEMRIASFSASRPAFDKRERTARYPMGDRAVFLRKRPPGCAEEDAEGVGAQESLRPGERVFLLAEARRNSTDRESGGDREPRHRSGRHIRAKCALSMPKNDGGQEDSSKKQNYFMTFASTIKTAGERLSGGRIQRLSPRPSTAPDRSAGRCGPAHRFQRIPRVEIGF
jgi:hypothetical protein